MQSGKATQIQLDITSDLQKWRDRKLIEILRVSEED